MELSESPGARRTVAGSFGGCALRWPVESNLHIQYTQDCGELYTAIEKNLESIQHDRSKTRGSAASLPITRSSFLFTWFTQFTRFPLACFYLFIS